MRIHFFSPDAFLRFPIPGVCFIIPIAFPPTPRLPRTPAMLTLLGSPRRACDRLTRRETLKAGSLALLGGFGLPQLLQAEAARPSRRAGRAKSVILLYLLGGAATQDMIDLKPNAPPE